MTQLSLDPNRPYQETNFDWAEKSLRAAASEYFDAVCSAASVRKDGFVPVDESAVDPSILAQYIADGREVGGIRSEREISNVVPFNAPHIADGIPDRHLAELRRAFDAEFRRQVRTLFSPRDSPILFRVADYFYPAGGYMGWHTNASFPGWRLYLTHGVVGSRRSFFRYRHPHTGEITTSPDEGWTMRLFLVSAERPIWHSVYAGEDRFSLGYMAHPWSLVQRARRAARTAVDWVGA